MPRSTELGKPDARGRYRKTLGPKGGEHVFYLGTDRAAAERAFGKLDRVWVGVEQRWHRAGRPTEKPQWDAIGLMIAKAVAAGKEEVTIPSYDLPPVSGDYRQGAKEVLRQETRELYRLTAILSKDFGVVVTLEEDDYAQEGRAEVERQRDELDRLLNVGQVKSGPMFHAALDQWGRREAARYEGRSEHGRKQVQRVEFLKRLFPDVPLSSLTNDRIGEILDAIAKRPITRLKGRGERPCSVDYAQKLLDVVRSFIDWLDASDLGWDKPKGYRVKPVKIVRTAEDDAKSLEVPVYKRSELQTLWQYGTPLERVYLALALNCAFGPGEVATLQVGEIHLASVTGKKHSYVKRIRRKTGVYGEWCLWPETVAAIEWYKANVNPSDTGEFILVKGQPLKLTEGGNRSPYLANMMTRLITRIKKDRPAFKDLSFGKLRKTSSTLVEEIGGPVMAKYHLSHGKPVDDETLKRYVRRKFKRLFRVHRRVRKLLDKVFDVAEPFPPGNKVKRPSLSRETIEAMRELRQQGVAYDAIVLKLGVSKDTIRRYTATPRKAKKAQDGV